jgi:hypothetical protein
MIKTCTKCGEEKPLTEFHKDKSKPDGHMPSCKACRKIAAATHYNDNLDRRRAENRESYCRNRGAKKAKQAEYRESHREEIRAKSRDYQKQNRHQYAANTARYRADKIQATPDWLTEDNKTFMSITYSMAGIITKMTGLKHVVDHIHPLRGRDFCGLHVPWNLQVITELENLEKSNKLLEL